jgi:exonuclease SbcC
MLRFGLFGTAALRGSRDDYNSLDMSLEWVTRGKSYKVERTIKNAKLYMDGTIEATGTRPVNVRITQVLGFDLLVFDIACVAQQGEMERLGTMLPSERKAMIDKTIGLDRINELVKWVNEEGTGLYRELETLQRMLGEPPTPPVLPEGYEPSKAVLARLQALRTLKQEHDELRGWLSHSTPMPVPPVPYKGPSREHLNVRIAAIRTNRAERARIPKIPTIDYDPKAVEQDWLRTTSGKSASASPRSTPDQS